jgi:phage gp29-like protein
MLRELLYHEEAFTKQTWEQPPIVPGENATSYAHMMLDPSVAYSVGLIQDAIVAGGWHIEPSDREDRRALAMAEDVRRNLIDLDVDAALHDALDAIWRGFACEEITWRYGRPPSSGRFWLDSLATLDPDQIALELDDRMCVTAILNKPTGREPQRVPREKVWMHVHRPSRRRPAGESILEPAYRAWSSKNRLLQFWGLSIQRFGMTHMIVRIPANTPPAEQTSILSTLYQGRLDGVYLLKEQYAVELLNPTQWANLTFEKAIDYQDQEIVKAILFTHSPGGVATGQTYVTGAGLSEQSRATAARLQRISRALARSFTLDVIAPLCMANWGAEPAICPRLVLPVPDPSRIATLAAPLAALVSAGIADPATAAEQIGLPEPGKGNEK